MKVSRYNPPSQVLMSESPIGEFVLLTDYKNLEERYAADKDILNRNQLVYELARAREELQSFYRMSSTGVWIKTEEYKKMVDEMDEMKDKLKPKPNELTLVFDNEEAKKFCRDLVRRWLR